VDATSTEWREATLLGADGVVDLKPNFGKRF
jgi:hypothetical protein